MYGLSSDFSLLDVKDLYTHFDTEAGVVQALDGVSFDVKAGEPVGIVGESGCGKSVTAQSVLRILPNNGRIAGGEVNFRGHNLLDFSEKQMQKVRGRYISMIFQDPLTSLNPIFTIHRQMVDVVKLHRDVGTEEATEICIDSLDSVGIPDPETRIYDYPFQYSGGMRQRILIARALALEPEFLIADEPTTALDVTIQAQVLELIKRVQKDSGLGMMLITHNLGVVAQMTERVHIFYGGRVVESGRTLDVFSAPKHPYTIALLDSIPSLVSRKEKLSTIEGNVPQLINPPKGCRFHPRCQYATEECKKRPPNQIVGKDHTVACIHLDMVEADFSGTDAVVNS